MKTKILTLCVALLGVAFIASAQNPVAEKMTLLSGGEGKGHTSEWIVENQVGSPVTLKGDYVDVVAAKGMTLWYNQKLKGEYQISYSVKFIMEGGAHDRLSDLNCFWGAADPESPKNFFKRAEW